MDSAAAPACTRGSRSWSARGGRTERQWRGTRAGIGAKSGRRAKKPARRSGAGWSTLGSFFPNESGRAAAGGGTQASSEWRALYSGRSRCRVPLGWVTLAVCMSGSEGPVGPGARVVSPACPMRRRSLIPFPTPPVFSASDCGHNRGHARRLYGATYRPSCWRRSRGRVRRRLGAEPTASP